MFNMSSKEGSHKSAGPGYIILNIIRVMNVISLLTVVVGSWIMLVRTVQTSNFFFFDGVSHFITSTIGLFLIVSELSIFKNYFETWWPLLSNATGFLFLGGSMFVLGFNILGNLNKSATSVDSLGLPLWRVVIAGGILSSVLGAINIVASLYFSYTAAENTPREIRSLGAVANQKALPKSVGSVSSSSTRRRASVDLPSYHATTGDRRRSAFGIRMPVRLSAISKPTHNDPEQFRKFESRSSPIVPDMQRPPTAMHPAYSPSRYSVASNMM